jgi:DNA-binding GntR family transcriptional regulator
MAFNVDGRTERLVDHVMQLLRERIVEGRYAPGTRLDRGRLADEVNVGRSVIGEALRALDREGLVTTTPSRSMCVAAIDHSLLLSTYELREVIDGLAARLAAARGGPVLEAALQTALADQREAAGRGDSRRFRRASIAFHSALIHASCNPLLISKVALVPWTARFAAPLAADRQPRAIAEHELILLNVCRHDGEAAEQAARAHVRASTVALKEAHSPTAPGERSPAADRRRTDRR